MNPKNCTLLIICLILLASSVGISPPARAAANSSCTADCSGGSCTATGSETRCKCRKNGTPNCKSWDLAEETLEINASGLGIELDGESTSITETSTADVMSQGTAGLELSSAESLLDGQILGLLYFDPNELTSLAEGVYALRLASGGSEAQLVDAQGVVVGGGSAVAELVPGDGVPLAAAAYAAQGSLHVQVEGAYADGAFAVEAWLALHP